MPIPIENIYYLLCYSWNKLDEMKQVNVSVDGKIELIDLSAKVLANSAKILLKRGVDKNYVDNTIEFSGVKGKVQISETLKRNLLHMQKSVCAFDIFSSDTILNKIIVTTIYRLLRTTGLNENLKSELVVLYKMLSGIGLIELSDRVFDGIRLNRNNHFYGFIMKVCQLLYESTLPSEKKGRYKFSDFIKDDHKMNRLFESFVRNFYKIEQKKFNTVKKEILKWQFEIKDNESSRYLPQTETDITLENDTEKIIIDAKYYSETMAVNYDREKIKSANLYQLFSYLINQRSHEPKTQTTKGILLYPTIDADYDLHYRYEQHFASV